jgi:tetratricopeptide (TPR) repeat protein
MPNAVPMVFYFLGYYASLTRDVARAKRYFDRAAAQSPDGCFPNSLDSILALQAALKLNPRDGRASFYLGNLWYDKRQVTEAIAGWEHARRVEPALPTVHRNLALAYFNKQNNAAKALKAMERAFALDQTDARVLLEFDLLKKRAQVAPEKRLAFLSNYRELVNQREDLLVEFVTLLNLSGHHEQAFQALVSRKFHPWEGGEGKVTGQYVVSLVEIAKELLGVVEPIQATGEFTSTAGASKPKKTYEGEDIAETKDATVRARHAIRLLDRAQVYPENLGEGKLQGTLENQIFFWLGVAHEQTGDTISARKYWKEATTGMKSPSPAVYYNDQNPETIFYQGLALQKLGRPAAGANRFRALVNFGHEHREDEIEIDYFAVSLPEFMVFDDDLNRRNQVNCRYLLALGLFGLGKRAEARAEFGKVLELEPGHLGVRLHAESWDFLAGKNRKSVS